MPTWRVGVLSCSTRGARGLRRDRSGKLLKTLCQKWWRAQVVHYEILPDERRKIARRLREGAALGLDVIFTTGGTGLSPTDVTPEATRDVISKEAPGLAERMRWQGGRRTLLAWLSRGVAGVRGKTLIINLPGSPRGVRENLAALRKILPHAVEIASGRHSGVHRSGSRASSGHAAR